MPETPLLLGLALTAAIAAIGAGLHRLAGTRARIPWIEALVLALAYAAGATVAYGWPHLPRPDVAAWPTALAVGLALAAAARCLPAGRPITAVLLVLATGGGAWAITHQLPATQAHAWAWAVAFGLGVGLLAGGWEFAARGAGPLTARAGLTLAAGCAFVVLMLSGSFTLGWHLALVAAALAAGTLVHAWRGVRVHGLGAVTGVLSAWLVLDARLLADPTLMAIALLAAAPLALALARVPALATRPRLAFALSLLAVALLGGAAIAWTWAYGQPEQPAAGAPDTSGW